MTSREIQMKLDSQDISLLYLRQRFRFETKRSRKVRKDGLNLLLSNLFFKEQCFRSQFGAGCKAIPHTLAHLL